MERRDEIKRIFFNHPELKECDVAFDIGMSPQTLNYQLNHAIKFDGDLEDAIYASFKKRGILTNTKDECVMLNDLFLEFTSIATQHISILANEIRKDIQNDLLEPHERPKLEKKIDDMETNLLAKLKELREIVRG